MHLSEPAITVNDLSYSFKHGKPVLNALNLTVPVGSIYGFLGPNGAGKTTSMRLLTGLLPQQGNSVFFWGQPLITQLPALFHRVGSLIETPSLYLHLNGLDNLRVVARMRGITEKAAYPALDKMKLSDAAYKKVKHYSLGMKQRLGIAMALLAEPELLLLDEPVNGLDPSGMVEVRQLLQQINKAYGTTIFISSHLLHEVEKMCDHIAIIHGGTVRFEGTMTQLSDHALAEKKLILGIDEASFWLEKIKEMNPSAILANRHQIELVVNSRHAAADINSSLVQAGAKIFELKLIDGLEEWFLAITTKP